MTLKDLQPGQSARITEVGGEGALRQHFLDMGVIPGAGITLVKLAPMKDPMEFRLHGYELTLRVADAAHIEAELVESLEPKNPKVHEKTVHHPGLGEDGIYHVPGSGNPLPDGTQLRFALVGNQNSGKTTLFNQLTGSNQHVGNFPGVTVDRKDGIVRGYPNATITDLPGIYSMSPYTKEEIVSRDFVLKEKPHCIINIVDVTSIDRSLYLTMQLLELGIPMVIALNMMDEMKSNGGSVDINSMEAMLGVPVVPISAAKNQGVDELVKHAMHVAMFQEGPLVQDFCGSDDNGGAVHRCIHAVIHLIEDHAQTAGIPVRFAASKIIGGDMLLLDQLKLDTNELEMLDHIVIQMEKERGLDRHAAIADMRYAYITGVTATCVTKPRESEERIRSQKLDKVLTGRFTAIPMFILIMGLVFFLTFFLIGPFLQDLLASGIGALQELVGKAMAAGNVNHAVQSLVNEGIFEGVGSVLSFMPIIVTMFLFLSLLEDSGYIARVAFVMDKILRKIGLSGRSIVPMLIGFGCTVPAVMSTRTLPSERDRKMTILLTPFMSCTAKLPIYSFFVSFFFPKAGWLVITALYLIGIITGILVALIFRKTLFKGEPVPFVMELPNYRLPQMKNVRHLLWDKTKDFIHRAFSVILLATIVVWFLKSFDFHFNMVNSSHDSILAAIAGLLVPVMKPIGLGDWRLITSLVSGFLAKEGVVSMMGILFASEGGAAAVVTPLVAAGMLVFSLLYTPCVAAVASVRRELGTGWAFSVVVWQCAVAWICTLIVRLLGMLVGLA